MNICPSQRRDDVQRIGNCQPNLATATWRERLLRWPYRGGRARGHDRRCCSMTVARLPKSTQSQNQKF